MFGLEAVLTRYRNDQKGFDQETNQIYVYIYIYTKTATYLIQYSRNIQATQDVLNYPRVKAAGRTSIL